MTNTKKGAALAAEKKIANANVVSKSEHDALVESTVDTILKDSKASAKSGKKQPTAEEIAAKAAKKAMGLCDKITKQIIDGTKHKVLSPTMWMKTAKAVAATVNPAIAKAIDEKWATINVNVKRCGACYTESVILKNGENGEAVHMIEWRDASKVTDFGRMFKPTAYRWSADEDFVAITSPKDLTIEHEVIEYEVLKQEFDGIEWTRKIEHKVLKQFRPVEVLDLNPNEFARRFKLAMQVTFPNGFSVEE